MKFQNAMLEFHGIFGGFSSMLSKLNSQKPAVNITSQNNLRLRPHYVHNHEDFVQAHITKIIHSAKIL